MLFKTALLALSSLGFQPDKEAELIRDFNKNFKNNSFVNFYTKLNDQKKIIVKNLLAGMKLSPEPDSNMSKQINNYWDQIEPDFTRLSQEHIRSSFDQEIRTKKKSE